MSGSAIAAKPIVQSLKFHSGSQFVTGNKITRATVATEYPGAPLGTIYLSSGSANPVYIKTASTGASVNTDWVKVSTSAAD